MNTMIYSHLRNELTDATFMVFEAMAEMATPEGDNSGIEANKWYRAADLKRLINMNIPSACLTSLVAKGLLEDDRDKNGKLYCITDEIYNDIDKVYFPTKEKHSSNWAQAWE